jgi:hypothetical protein
MVINQAIVYERIGAGYRRGRREDPRIAAPLLAALGGASPVLNVGAGAGSYEPADRPVVAVEPSPVMLAQRPAGAAPAVRAGPGRGARWWLYHYFPATARLEKSRETRFGDLAAMLGGRIDVTPVPDPRLVLMLSAVRYGCTCVWPIGPTQVHRSWSEPVEAARRLRRKGRAGSVRREAAGGVGGPPAAADRVGSSAQCWPWGDDPPVTPPPRSKLRAVLALGGRPPGNPPAAEQAPRSAGPGGATPR